MFQLFDVVPTSENVGDRRDVQCLHLFGRRVEDGQLVHKRAFDFPHECFAAVDTSFTEEHALWFKEKVNQMFRTKKWYCFDEYPVTAANIVWRKASLGYEPHNRPFLRLQVIHTKYINKDLYLYLNEMLMHIKLPPYMKGCYGFEHDPIDSYLTVVDTCGFDFLNERGKKVPENQRPDVTGIPNNWRMLTFDIETPSTEEEFPTPDKVAIGCIAFEALWEFQMYFMRVKSKTNYIPVNEGIEEETPHKEEERGFKRSIRMEFDTELEMLLAFKAKFLELDPDIITGYNVCDFDFPFILERLKKHRVRDWDQWSRLKNAPLTYGKKETKSNQSGGFEYSEVKIPGRVVLDELILARRDGFFKGLKKFTLNDVCKKAEVDGKEGDVDVRFLHAYMNGTKEQQSLVRRYNEEDVKATRRLVIKRDMINTMISFCGTFKILPFDHLKGIPSYRGKRVFTSFSHKEVLRRATIYNPATGRHDLPLVVSEVPDEVNRIQNGYEGGRVKKPRKGFVDQPMCSLDFASLYPNIITEYNLCPTMWLRDHEHVERLGLIKDRDYEVMPNNTMYVKRKGNEMGILPRLCQYFITQRGVYKKKKAQATNPVEYSMHETTELALKVGGNAMYGLLGMAASVIANLGGAEAVTAQARYHITFLEEFITRDPDLVDLSPNPEYADTDSLFVSLQGDVKDYAAAMVNFDRLHKSVNVSSGLNTRTTYLSMAKENYIVRAVFLGKKKSYIYKVCTLKDGVFKYKIVVKGLSIIKGDAVPYFAKVGMELINMVMLPEEKVEVSKVIEFVKTKIQAFLINEVPKEEFIITKKLSKPLAKIPLSHKHCHVEAARMLKAAGHQVRAGDFIQYYYCKKENSNAKKYTKVVPVELAAGYDLDLEPYYELFKSSLKDFLEAVIGDLECSRVLNMLSYRRRVPFVHTLLTQQLRIDNRNVFIHDKNLSTMKKKRTKKTDEKGQYDIGEFFTRKNRCVVTEEEEDSDYDKMSVVTASTTTKMSVVEEEENNSSDSDEESIDSDWNDLGEELTNLHL